MADVVDSLPQRLEVALLANTALAAGAHAGLRAALPMWGASELCETPALLVSEFLTHAIQHTQASQSSVRDRWKSPVLRGKCRMVNFSVSRPTDLR